MSSNHIMSLRDIQTKINRSSVSDLQRDMVNNRKITVKKFHVQSENMTPTKVQLHGYNIYVHYDGVLYAKKSINNALSSKWKLVSDLYYVGGVRKRAVNILSLPHPTGSLRRNWRKIKKANTPQGKLDIQKKKIEEVREKVLKEYRKSDEYKKEKAEKDVEIQYNLRRRTRSRRTTRQRSKRTNK